jgi:hypothetical protein
MEPFKQYGQPFYENAYIKTFNDTINFALHRNHNLWNEYEIELLTHFMSDSLSDDARLILSRLSLRRAKWIKSTSISHYVLKPMHRHNSPSAQPNEDFSAEASRPVPIDLTSWPEEDTKVLFRALQELHEKQFVECLTAKTQFETAMEAVSSCFLSDDLLRLSKRLSSSKGLSTSGGGINGKPLTKDELLAAIRVAVTTQRTLFGQPLSHKFAQTVIDSIKDMPVSTSDGTAGAGHKRYCAKLMVLYAFCFFYWVIPLTNDGTSCIMFLLKRRVV